MAPHIVRRLSAVENLIEDSRSCAPSADAAGWSSKLKPALDILIRAESRQAPVARETRCFELPVRPKSNCRAPAMGTNADSIDACASRATKCCRKRETLATDGDRPVRAK